MDRVAFYLGLWILFNLTVVGVYDLYALFVIGSATATVSYYVQSWARDFPAGVLALGILLGHLFWPISPHEH